MSAPGVVITGMGCVSASGNRTADLAANLRAGTSGVRIEGSDGADWDLGPVSADFEGRVKRLALRRLDDSMRRALHAALQAVDAAGLDVTEPTKDLGVVVATGYAGTASSHAFIRTVWEHGPDGADPSLFPNTVPNGPAGQLAIHLKARGPGTNFFEADTAGESALRYARREILAGHADAVLVCGVDERPEAVVAVEELYRRARTRRAPAGLLRPFDAARSGTTMGQASAAVLLESAEAARRRGAEPLAVLGPVELGAEASPPGAWPRKPETLARTALRALEAAGAGGDIAFTNTCARGSREYDAFEARALELVTDALGRGRPVCAPMGYTGSLSTSALFRLVVSVLGLREGFVPATARLLEPDAALGVDVAPEARPLEGNAVLQIGAGAGGTNAALVVSRP
ncbi:MAG: beta-ketoacyl synthase N-terminal-like domain-containing protein [Planctomycetota bacterium]